MTDQPTERLIVHAPAKKPINELLAEYSRLAAELGVLETQAACARELAQQRQDVYNRSLRDGTTMDEAIRSLQGLLTAAEREVYSIRRRVSRKQDRLGNLMAQILQCSTTAEVESKTDAIDARIAHLEREVTSKDMQLSLCLNRMEKMEKMLAQLKDLMSRHASRESDTVVTADDWHSLKEKVDGLDRALGWSVTDTNDRGLDISDADTSVAEAMAARRNEISELYDTCDTISATLHGLNCTSDSLQVAIEELRVEQQKSSDGLSAIEPEVKVFTTSVNAQLTTMTAAQARDRGQILHLSNAVRSLAGRLDGRPKAQDVATSSNNHRAKLYK